MVKLFANNPASTLLSGITSGALTLTVQAGDGAEFPSPTGVDSFRATLEDAGGLIEIIDVTSRTGDVFTITRGEEGTLAKVYVAGDAVELRVTKEVLEDFLQSLPRKVSDKGVNYTILSSDNANLINMTGAFIPSLPDAGTVLSNFYVFIKNSHSAPITIGRVDSGDTIDGVTGDDSLASQQGAVYVLNSTTNGYLRLSSEIFTTLVAATLLVNTTANFTGIATFAANIVLNAELVINEGYSEDLNIYSITSGTKILDISAATYFHSDDPMTPVAITFQFDNPAVSGRVTSFTMEIDSGGTATSVTFPATVHWVAGAPPILSITGVDVLTFVTRDGGLSWLGFVAGLDLKLP